MTFPISYRQATDKDLPFVLDAWIASQGSCRPWKELDRNWYCAAAHALAYRILSRATVVAMLAVEPDDHDQIFGFSILECTANGNIVHWAFVKKPFRNCGVFKGIMRFLLGDNWRLFRFSSRTPIGAAITGSGTDSHSLCERV